LSNKIALQRRERMTVKPGLAKKIFIIGIVVLVVLNLYTFIVAYPETLAVDAGISTQGSTLAKDFSAYYMGAWRLWHNPSQIYTYGPLADGEPFIFPSPETYKYLPSFLLVVSPFLELNYQNALLAFDLAQFLLLPVLAYMLYKLLDKKQLAVTFIVIIIALLLPFPTLKWGFSPSYYWQWAEGQAKVFDIFFLVLSFYLASRGRPYLSGIAFAFGFFDPRFGLLAIALFLMYNQKNLKPAVGSAVGSLLVSNAMLLYPGMASSFSNMVFASAVTTPLYYYSLIPFLTLMALIVVNFKGLVAFFDYRGIFADYTGVKKTQQAA